MKRPLQEEGTDGEAKQACSDLSSDVEEFFALLKRIEATEKQFGPLRSINSGKPLHPHPPCHKNEEASTSKPAWRPSFVWEDFCGNRNVTREVESKAPEGNSEEGNRLANDQNKDNNNNCVKRLCIYLDENNNGDTESATERPDLNLPSELQLFH